MSLQWFNDKKYVESASISIKKTSDGNLVALIRNSTSHPNTIFALQTTSDLSNFQQINIDNAYINESEKCVEFRSSTNQQKVIFKLSSAHCPIASQGTLIFNRYGLINQKDEEKHTLVSNFSGPVLPSVSEILHCECHTKATIPSCLAGGVGALECSYEVSGRGNDWGRKCSVKCEGDGRYACCYDR